MLKYFQLLYQTRVLMPNPCVTKKNTMNNTWEND